MSSWLESYQALPEEQKANVQRWIHLNKFIARTLRIEERRWFEEYLGDAMAHPLDYSFMDATIPEYDPGADGFAASQGQAFVQGVEAVGPKIPLRAENNLGRLSPELQDAIASMLEKGEPLEKVLLPSDVAQLQKIFPGAKDLARLKRPDFRNVKLLRDSTTEDLVLRINDGAEIFRLNLMELSAVLSRKLF